MSDVADEDVAVVSPENMPEADPGSLQASMNAKTEVYNRMRRSKQGGGRSGSKGLFRSLLKGRFGMLIFFAVGALSLNWLFKNFFGGSEGGSGGSSSSELDFSSQKLSKGKLRRLPVCRDGIVVVTDAAYGSARETALLLADQGMYVLAAVKTKVELKSFVYEERKGLELIVADPIEPNEVAKLFYRVKQLQNDLDRKFFGLIINTADSVLDLDSVNSLREKYQLEQDKQEEASALEQGPPGKSKRNQDKLDMRNATAADLSQDDIVNAASLVDVPSLDDGYKTILKSSMRIAQAALEMFSESESAFRADLRAKEEVMSTKYLECISKSGSGLDDDASGECYNSLQTERDRLAKKIKNKKNKKLTARDVPATKEDFGAETCAAGATGRILFMTYNFEGVVGAKVDTPLEKPRGIVGLLGGGKVPKRATKSKYRRGRALVNPQQARTMTELNAFYFPLGCGMHCSIKAAMDSYIDQLRNVVMKSANTVSSKGRYGTYHIAEMAVPSKAYRSQKASRSRRGKAPFGREADLQLPSHFWEVDAAEHSRRLAEKDSKDEQRRNRYSTVINTRYSETANQAAHAIIGPYPKTVYTPRLRI